MTKRSLDVACALSLLILLLPLLCLIAIGVKLSSSGPVIFQQKRVGFRGQTFVMYKFRTLFDGTEKPCDLVLVGDLRITRLGKFLRASHLDELPQLWNIVMGKMSFVGPRPLPLDLTVSYMRLVQDYGDRLSVKPGLTGPQQIRGRLWKEKHKRRSLQLDIFYAKKHNLAWDLLLIFRTVKTVLKMQGV